MITGLAVSVMLINRLLTACR